MYARNEEGIGRPDQSLLLGSKRIPLLRLDSRLHVPNEV